MREDGYQINKPPWEKSLVEDLEDSKVPLPDILSEEKKWPIIEMDKVKAVQSRNPSQSIRGIIGRMYGVSALHQFDLNKKNYTADRISTTVAHEITVDDHYQQRIEDLREQQAPDGIEDTGEYITLEDIKKEEE